MTIQFLDEEVSAPPSAAKPRSRRIVFAGEEDVGPTPAPDRAFFSVEDVFSALGGVPEALAVGLPAAAVKGYQGLSMPERSEAIEREMAFAQRVQQDQEDREAAGKATSIGSAIRGALPSAGFTGVNLPIAIGAGFAGAAAGGPAAWATGPAAAMAASGTASYRMAGADLLYRAFKTLEQNKGAPLTEEEKADAYRELLPFAQDAGLWEAGPEAVSNVLMMKAGKFIFGFGKGKAKELVTEAIENTNKTLTRKLAEKAAVGVGTVGAEVLSEGVTAMGQFPAEKAVEKYAMTGEAEGGVTEYPGGYWQAVKDVAPSTIALTMGVGLAGGGAKLMTLPFRQQKSPEQIAQDNIDLEAEREANNLMIPPTDEEAKGLQASVERMRQSAQEKKEIYAGLEPTDPAAQQLGLEIRELEKAVGLAEAEIAKRVTPESEQARLAREIAGQQPAPTEDLMENRNKDLFPDTTDFAGKLPTDVRINTYTEKDGIGTAEYVNPANGSTDVYISAFGDNDFIAYIRIYDEQGNPTNRFASKLERRTERAGATRTMIEELQGRLPAGHEYTEDVSASTDGLRFISSQLQRGYDLVRDDKGNVETNRIAINGESIVNDLGADVIRQGQEFADIQVTNRKTFDRVKGVIAPLLERFNAGLGENNIYWENGRVYVDIPVLRKAEPSPAPAATPAPTTEAAAPTAEAPTVTPAPVSETITPAGEAAPVTTPAPAEAVTPAPAAEPAGIAVEEKVSNDTTKEWTGRADMEPGLTGDMMDDMSSWITESWKDQRGKPRFESAEEAWNAYTAYDRSRGVSVPGKRYFTESLYPQLTRTSTPAGIARKRKGEAGGVLIPTKQDFIDAGQNIYEAGMEFATWARQMVTRFGDAVRQFLGEVWQAVSGIPAKINELAGFLPQAGERGAVRFGRGEEPSQPIGPAPESPEGQSVPQALGNGIDIGPENNMPINRKIDSHIKNFLFLRGFFESASDRLRRNGFTRLGNAIDAYFDGARRRLGDANKIMLAPLEAYEAAPAAQKRKIEEDFQTFFAAQENKRDTDAIVKQMEPIARRIVRAWQKFGEESGKENQRVGVKVFDPKSQSWRKIGRVEKFWPRRLKPEYQRALMDPDKYAKEYNEIVEALLESGQIKDAKEAEKYLREYSPEATKNDYFSGIEKARGNPLPEKLYDYSMQVMTDYIARWAQHVSRIEQFGQKTSEQSMTLWDREMGTTRDPRTRDYIQAARERVEGYFPNDPFLKGAAALNIWATGLHLGNPGSAMLNMVGGSTLNAMIGQPGALGSYVESLVELRNLGANIRDAKEKGILGRDLMNIVGDHQAILETNKVVQAGQKTADFLLKWSGFTSAEQMVRAQSLIIGKSFVRNTLNAFKTDPRGSFARRASAWMTRNNFDLDKLIVEDGTGPETDRLLRYFANISQGSYTIDQVPIFIDTPAGRFLLKYQKFSTQVMRMTWKNTFEPLFKAMTGKGETMQVPDKTRQLIYRLLQEEARSLGDNRRIDIASIPKTVSKAQGRALALIPAMMWLGAAYVGGEVLLRLRDMLFGVLMKGPEYEDILKALEDDERAAALYLSLERAWYNLIGIGALGLIGNYAQFFLDWQDRERVKNPLEPPALSVVKDFVSFVGNAIDQRTITAGDVDAYASSTLSAYRATKRFAQSIAGFMGLEELPGVEQEMFRREVNNINKYARRWAEEAGIEYRTRRPGDVPISPRTPVNRKIASYMQTGEPVAAATYAKAYIKGLEKKEQDNARQSMLTGARNRQPLRLGSGPMDQAERKAFLEWLKGKVNDERFKEISELDAKYQKDYKTFLSEMKRP